MKFILSLSISLWSLLIFGQDVIFIDEVTKRPISNVNIFNNNFGTISNVDGIANLSGFNANDFIQIKHISYIDLKIEKNGLQDKVYLYPNSYILETINFEEIKQALNYNGILSKIERKKIEEIQPSTISELFKKTIGVSVQESQSGGGSPNYRGMEANRLLIVIDGIPLNNAIYRNGHIQSSSSINPFFINNIRAVTGPASVVYGDGAMGGALIVNTITKNSFNRKSNILFQKYESANESSSLNYLSTFDLKKLTFINGFSIKSNGNIKMGSNRLHGYKKWGNEAHVVEKNKQLNTSYNSYDFIQKIFINRNKKEKISLNSQFSTTSKISRFDKMNDLEGGIGKYKNWYYGPQTRIAQNLNYTKKTNNVLSDKYSLILAWQNVKESRHKQKTNDQYLSNRNENVLILDGVFDIKKTIKRFKLNYGVSYRKQFVNSKANLVDNNNVLFNTTRYPDGGSSVVDGSIYTQINWSVFKKTTIFFGERYNLNFLTAEFENNDIYNLPFSKITTKNKALVSSFLINQKIFKKSSLNIAYYMGYRNPNIDDIGKIFSKNDYAVVIPNENLKPEQSSNFETSLLINLEKIILEAQYYNIRITNAIQRSNSSLNDQDSIIYDGDLMQIQMNQNISSARINGFSLASDIMFSKKTNLDFKFNYIKGKTNLNRPLSHLPPINSIISLTHKTNKNRYTISYNFNGWKKAEDYDDNGVDNIEEATIDGNPSWQTIDISWSLQATENIDISCKLENIMDIHYKTFGSGLSAKGRNFILSLKTNF